LVLLLIGRLIGLLMEAIILLHWKNNDKDRSKVYDGLGLCVQVGGFLPFLESDESLGILKSASHKVYDRLNQKEHVKSEFNNFLRH